MTDTHDPDMPEPLEIPEEGAEKEWQLQRAAYLLRFASELITDPEADGSEMPEVNQLMKLAHKIAGYELEDLMEKRDGRKPAPTGSGEEDLDGDIPF